MTNDQVPMTDDPMEPVADAPPSRLLSYLRLFRLPNVFTAAADVAMGFIFVNRGSTLEVLDVLACLVVASCFFYTAGMILNDVFDYKVYSVARPNRPLPSGEIDVRWARWLGIQMLILGIGLAFVAGFVRPDTVAMPWRSGVIGLALAACILLYNGLLKKTPVAPIFMGACRFFNVLLGMGAALASSKGWLSESRIDLLTFDVSELIVAAGIGIYIAGVTWFARNEAGESDASKLSAAVVVMLGGIALLGIYPHIGAGGERIMLKEDMQFMWRLLLAMLGFTIGRRCFTAVMRPSPKRVQMAVKQSILSLIVLDASVCLMAAGPAYGLAVMALIVPMIWLGMWVYST